ncbi:hypothetical protein HMPREF3232_01127 [Fannyhessea vaginae]|nr:hypothetical protein HMPREF3232_01127 [Fannyhessea vaginae]
MYLFWTWLIQTLQVHTTLPVHNSFKLMQTQQSAQTFAARLYMQL